MKEFYWIEIKMNEFYIYSSLILKNSWIDYQNLKKQASAMPNEERSAQLNHGMYYNGIKMTLFWDNSKE